MLHEQMLNLRRHKLVLRDWLVEYGPYAPGYKSLSELRRPEPSLDNPNWPTKYEIIHEEYSSDKASMTMNPTPGN
jgi:hypothetical protein